MNSTYSLTGYSEACKERRVKRARLRGGLSTHVHDIHDLHCHRSAIGGFYQRGRTLDLGRVAYRSELSVQSCKYIRLTLIILPVSLTSLPMNWDIRAEFMRGDTPWVGIARASGWLQGVE